MQHNSWVHADLRKLLGRSRFLRGHLCGVPLAPPRVIKSSMPRRRGECLTANQLGTSSAWHEALENRYCADFLHARGHVAGRQPLRNEGKPEDGQLCHLPHCQSIPRAGAAREHLLAQTKVVVWKGCPSDEGGVVECVAAKRRHGGRVGTHLERLETQKVAFLFNGEVHERIEGRGELAPRLHMHARHGRLEWLYALHSRRHHCWRAANGDHDPLCKKEGLRQE
mmetsp:Transcript_2155/g.5518  ORF Transcript_2155/g.5518 Transcript_2155/m.5518 type:complete len:224 (-) Transcript_2155:391-1062(-)